MKKIKALIVYLGTKKPTEIAIGTSFGGIICTNIVQEDDMYLCKSEGGLTIAAYPVVMAQSTYEEVPDNG